MQHQVVEVVARIGDSIVHAAHVSPDRCFSIGTHAGVDLPIADGALGAFPLVDRGLVLRTPAGFRADVTPDGATRIAIGRVVIDVRLVPAPCAVVPRRPIELRPLC